MNSQDTLSVNSSHYTQLACGPLNCAQQRLWYLYQFAIDRHQHNLVLTLNLHGPINRSRLNRAITNLLARHPALRSRIENADGGTQVVLPPPKVELIENDLMTLPLSEQQTALERYRQHELHTPFDLFKSTTPRWRLFKRARDRYHLVITLHHIVFDGLSFELAVNELARDYAGRHPAADRDSRPAMSLIEHALWEKSPDVQAGWKPLLAFWQRRLNGFPQHIALPESVSSSDRTSSFSLSLESASLTRLQACARKRRLLLFVLLKAVFDLILFHYCRQSRFLVGTDIAGRTHSGLGRTIGFFVNQVPLPSEIDLSLPVGTWLEELSRNTRQVLNHRDLPFDRLVSRLANDRADPGAPLFQVKMNYQKRRQEGLPFGEARLAKSQVQQHLGAFYLVLDLVHEKNSLDAEFEYQQRYFSPQKIRLIAHLWRRSLKNFDDFLDGTLADADARLAQWSRETLSGQQHAETPGSRSTLKRRRAL